MNWLTIAIVLYGIAVAAGGIMGYATAQSTMSGITGGVSGLIILVAAALSKSSPRLGYGLAAVMCVVLIGFFFYRYIDTQKAMPAFGVIALSLVMLLLLIFGHFMARPPAEPV